MKMNFFHMETDFDLEVIKHITKLRDSRALNKLREIVNWPEESFALKIEENNFRSMNKIKLNCVLVALAIEGILTIGGSSYIKEVIKFRDFGIQSDVLDEDLSSILRYHFVRGLRECLSRESLDVLEIMKNDNDKYVRGFAYDAIRKIQQEVFEPSFSINMSLFKPLFSKNNVRLIDEERNALIEEQVVRDDDSDLEELEPIE